MILLSYEPYIIATSISEYKKHVELFNVPEYIQNKLNFIHDHDSIKSIQENVNKIK